MVFICDPDLSMLAMQDLFRTAGDCSYSHLGSFLLYELPHLQRQVCWSHEGACSPVDLNLPFPVHPDIHHAKNVHTAGATLPHLLLHGADAGAHSDSSGVCCLG